MDALSAARHDADVGRNSKESGIFSKALSCAGVVFEAKWDADGYKTFLEENGFEVKRSKQLASTRPLMYTECIIEKGSY